MRIVQKKGLPCGPLPVHLGGPLVPGRRNTASLFLHIMIDSAAFCSLLLSITAMYCVWPDANHSTQSIRGRGCMHFLSLGAAISSLDESC